LSNNIFVKVIYTTIKLTNINRNTNKNFLSILLVYTEKIIIRKEGVKKKEAKLVVIYINKNTDKKNS